MRSLRTRLSSSLIITLVVMMGLLLAIGGYSLRQLAEDFVATGLEHDMEALLATLTFDRDKRPTIEAPLFNPIFNQPYSGHYYEIRTATGKLRSRSLWDTELTFTPGKEGVVNRIFHHGPQQQQLLILASIFRLQGNEVEIAVAEDFTPIIKGLHRIILDLVLIVLSLLGVLIFAQRLIIRRGLKPLEQTRHDISCLERGELRQLNTDAPVEIRPLVEEINHLIQVMEQRLQRSRHALGNLAHALKTPLTVLTQLAEPPRKPEQGDPYGELAHQTQQIRLLIDRELKRARIAGMSNPAQRIVLAEEVTHLADTLKKIHWGKALDIQCRIPADCIFPGDRDDLLEMLGNLLDNACHWAVAKVRMTVVEAIGHLTFIIEDDGPGCPREQLELLTQRGMRIDESRAGHGLGLSIVADIVEQYNGDFSFSPSTELGGFLARVELPYHSWNQTGSPQTSRKAR